MRVLVVGHGEMGKRHARIVKKAGHTPITVDPRPQSTAQYRKIEKGHSCQMAIVAVPPERLTETAAKTIDLELPTLLEKPCATSVAEAISLAMHPHRDLIHVGYVERHNPAVQALADNLGLIGDPIHATAQRLGPAPGRSLTTPLLDLASHDLDVLRHVTGTNPTKAKHVTLTDIHAAAVLEMDDFTATLEASYAHPTKHRTLTFVGTEGMLSLDYQKQTLHYTTTSHSTEIRVDRGEPLMLQWQAFEAGDGPTLKDAITVLSALTPSEVKA